MIDHHQPEPPMRLSLYIVALAVVVFGVLPSCAQAKVIGTADGPSGYIELHDTQNGCVGSAHHAAWVGNDGERIAGCWVTDGRNIRAVFLDGDTVTFPASVVKQAI